MTYSSGQAILFQPGAEPKPPNKWRKGTVVADEVPQHPHLILIRLYGDPFDVCVSREQVKPASGAGEGEAEMSPKDSKPRAKELRREAKALGVEDWADMTLDELEAAVKKARKNSDKPEKAAKAEKAAPAKATKAAAKKAAPAKKAAAKKAAAASDDSEPVNANGNPYKKGTNLHLMAEALMKGGKIGKLVDGLTKKIEIDARTREYTPESHRAEIHRRLVIVSQNLEKLPGWTREKEGRGEDGYIKCSPPSDD